MSSDERKCLHDKLEQILDEITKIQKDFEEANEDEREKRNYDKEVLECIQSFKEELKDVMFK